MIVKIYSKFRSGGARALLDAIYSRISPRRLFRRVFPSRLAYYAHCKRFFEAKTGLEIGGPSNIFRKSGIIPVYPVAARVDNCNFALATTWEDEISEGDTFCFDNKKAPGRQYISEASDLSCLGPESYDFILSSHCIEHLANPMQALAEWTRVLRENGLLVLVVPHKDGTFDHRRPVTSIAHLIEDFEQQTDESDMTHLDEIVELHDLAKDPGAGDLADFKERSARNFENRCMHHHVFDTPLVIEMIHFMGLQILAVEIFQPYHIVLIGQKLQSQPRQSIDNDRFRTGLATRCWRSSFPSDELARDLGPTSTFEPAGLGRPASRIEADGMKEHGRG